MAREERDSIVRLRRLHSTFNNQISSCISLDIKPSSCVYNVPRDRLTDLQVMRWYLYIISHTLRKIITFYSLLLTRPGLCE
jgi:hypothetical protein